MAPPANVADAAARALSEARSDWEMPKETLPAALNVPAKPPATEAVTDEVPDALLVTLCAPAVAVAGEVDARQLPLEENDNAALLLAPLKTDGVAAALEESENGVEALALAAAVELLEEVPSPEPDPRAPLGVPA